MKEIPERYQGETTDKWDLSQIFADLQQWEMEFQQIEAARSQYAQFRQHFKESAAFLKKCLDFDTEIRIRMETLGSYAFLKNAENITASEALDMMARYTGLSTRIQEDASFILPRTLQIDDRKMERIMKSALLDPYRNMLLRWLRHRPHILSIAEEKILAMQGEIADCSRTIFRQLNDADFCFGTLRTPKGPVQLTHGNWGSFLEHPDRTVRKSAFQKMFGQYEKFSNTVSTIYNTSVLQDVYEARVRHFRTSRESALFDNNISTTVYDQLTETVRSHIHLNHRYLDLIRKKNRQTRLHFYDTYVPLVKSVKWHMNYDTAVTEVVSAMRPLGEAYCRILENGLTRNRWVDRYENKGKQSGAFSAGGYRTPPYILLNYRDDTISGVYTLAHEGGHSMHTYYSARHQRFMDYDYPIFVAEVASTFNEQLLTHHLLQKASSPDVRTYLVDREIQQIRGTIIRQTMFAEFEKKTHDIAEKNESLTPERLRKEYEELLRFYFGKYFVIDPALTMEWARIPHFYNAFYVYQYATGLTAAVALSDQVLQEKRNAKSRYLRFLKSGASDYPLSLLKQAGADLSTPKPIEAAMIRLDRLLTELEELLG